MRNTNIVNLNPRWCLPLLVWSLSGCMSIDAIPPTRLPLELLAESRTRLQETSLTRLRQDQPETYLLDSGDTLGIFIETVLGEAQQNLPVQAPSDTSSPPAIGYPVVVADDGTIDLPYVDPISVRGLSLEATRRLIRKAYIEDRQILPAGRERILVSMIRPRTYRVLVIREEQGQSEHEATQTTPVPLKKGIGRVLDLKAYENDVLHALNLTGGLPGDDAQNEVLVYRGLFAAAEYRDQAIAAMHQGNDRCAAPLADPDDPNVVRIPLRFTPEDAPHFTQNDIILDDGDVVVIKARDADIFYVGGLLQGQAFPLPRDHDLRVLEAIAVGGGSVGGQGTGLGNLGRGGILANIRSSGAGVPPTLVHVIRQSANGAQVPIRIDLKKALVDPDENILVQSGDMILLQYRLHEEMANALLGVFSVNWIAQLNHSSSF